ncbi:hypothetical protein AYX14_00909, partial [Cryptococcus neoformans]
SLVGHLSVVSCIALHQPRSLYYGERFPLVVPLTASIISFLLILQMISAAPSRSKALLASVCRRPIPRTAQSVRHYTNGQKQEEPVIPSINELLSKKSIKSAWAALSTTKKLLFGVVVIIGGAGEYALMKKYILEPAKERKRLRDQDSKVNAQLEFAGSENKNVIPESQ